MRSHLTAFGLGAGLVLLAGGVLAIVGPRFIEIDGDKDGARVVNLSDGDSGSFQLKDGGLAVAARWKGDFAFAGDGRSLTELARSLEVEIKEGESVRKAIFELRDGKIVVTASLDEKPLEGADADAEAAALLQTFARASGVNAEQRLKAIIASGGKGATLDEIGALSGGHASGAYIGALARLATLNDDDIVRLAGLIGAFRSDYAKRQSLVSLLENQKPSETGLKALIAAAASIGSDHEVRLIVEALADREMSPENAAAATALLSAIESDHEIRLAAEALLASEAVRNPEAVTVIAAALGAVKSDYELRLVIEAAAKRLGDAEVAAAVIKGAEAIKSAHELRLAIDTIAGNLEEASPSWPALIALAKGVGSDHERRLAVEALAGKAPKSPQVRAALADLAASIASDHDRRLAQDAIK
jgi:hypothetical protein